MINLFGGWANADHYRIGSPDLSILYLTITVYKLSSMNQGENKRKPAGAELWQDQSKLGLVKVSEIIHFSHCNFLFLFIE